MKKILVLSILTVCILFLYNCQSAEEQSREELRRIYALREQDQGRFLAELEGFIKDTPEELPTYAQAVRLYTAGFKNLAQGWISNGRYDQALEFIEKALVYNEDNKELLELKKLCLQKGDVTKDDIDRIARGMDDKDVIRILGNPIDGMQVRQDPDTGAPFYVMAYMIELDPQKRVIISLDENKSVALIRYRYDGKTHEDYPERTSPPLAPEVEETEEE